MFLIRSAFWLALLVMILPSDPKEQARLYETASYGLHQAMTFCDRNPTICHEANEYWVAFQAKLAVGGRMLVDLANERMRGASPQAGPGLPAPTPAVDTLSTVDKQPPWRGDQRTRL